MPQVFESAVVVCVVALGKFRQGGPDLVSFSHKFDLFVHLFASHLTIFAFTLSLERSEQFCVLPSSCSESAV